uniref:Uncharacterized protein n=1 Tax=Arundo donax TaxID=35708 RepID=A0A0A8XS34_ARUDO
MLCMLLRKFYPEMTGKTLFLRVLAEMILSMSMKTVIQKMLERASTRLFLRKILVHKGKTNLKLLFHKSHSY